VSTDKSTVQMEEVSEVTLLQIRRDPSMCLLKSYPKQSIPVKLCMFLSHFFGILKLCHM